MLKHYQPKLNYKNFNLKREVGITIKSKKISSQLKPVRNSYVAI